MIVIAGKAGSGKDTLADYLCAKHQYQKVALADPMKEFCKQLFGWTADQLWGSSHLRNQEDPRWDGLTPREALQWLGTEWGRKCHPDVWVNYLLRTVQDHCVVSDIRYPNELQAFVEHGAYTVLLQGTNVPLFVGPDHSSEATSWDPKDFDVVLPRYATALDMCHAAEEQLSKLGAL